MGIYLGTYISFIALLSAEAQELEDFDGPKGVWGCLVSGSSFRVWT